MARGEARRQAFRAVRLRAGQHLLLLNGVAAPGQPGDPTVLADGTLRWNVASTSGPVHPSVHGASRAHARADAATRDHPDRRRVAAAPTPAPVSVGDTLEPNDTPATANADHDRRTARRLFNLSYLTASRTSTTTRFPIPTAGSRMTFHLSHLPADYDLVVYGPTGAACSHAALASTPPIDGEAARRHGFATTHATDPLARRASTTSRSRTACRLRRLDAARHAGRRGRRRLER